MVRTQIQLPEKEYDELRELALRERRSMADCIREGIRWVLRRSRGAEDEIAAIAMKFRPVPLDDLKPHDRWYAKAAASPRQRRGRK